MCFRSPLANVFDGYAIKRPWRLHTEKGSPFFTIHVRHGWDLLNMVLLSAVLWEFYQGQRKNWQCISVGGQLD